VDLGVWVSTGDAGTLGTPADCPVALLESIASLPAQIPRSGAPALLALGFVAAADFALRGGLIRHYAKK
jgi:hypothetical protein